MAVRIEREEFEKLTHQAIAELPDAFRPYLQGMEVRVEDYPEDALMEEWGMAPPDYPFGMYEGAALPEVQDRNDFPGVLVLYQRPIEEWCRDLDELRDQVRRTVFHEIGHRLGYPDEEMPDEVRGGVADRWDDESLRAEGARHGRQAVHDLRAAEVLQEGGWPDWALDVAMTAADRALRALLMAQGKTPDELEQDGLPELLARIAAVDRGYRTHRPLLRLDSVSTDLGDPRRRAPSERIALSVSGDALEHARILVEEVERVYGKA